MVAVQAFRLTWVGGLTRVPLVPEVPVEIGTEAVPSLFHAVLPPQSVLLIDMIKCVLPAIARLKYTSNIDIKRGNSPQFSIIKNIKNTLVDTRIITNDNIILFMISYI